eukprot:3331865-Prymnesium_polylepis.1
MTSTASAKEIEALQSVSQDSSYGRSLLFVQHRAQVKEAGVAARPGTAAYAGEVFQTVTDAPRSRSTRHLLEDKPDDGVIKLDGWLALADGDVGGARVWNRENARKFVAAGGRRGALLAADPDCCVRVVELWALLVVGTGWVCSRCDWVERT